VKRRFVMWVLSQQKRGCVVVHERDARIPRCDDAQIARQVSRRKAKALEENDSAALQELAPLEEELESMRQQVRYLHRRLLRIGAGA
jgi:hypothetical protein